MRSQQFKEHVVERMFKCNFWHVRYLKSSSGCWVGLGVIQFVHLLWILGIGDFFARGGTSQLYNDTQTQMHEEQG